jgi:hypothetical protein
MPYITREDGERFVIPSYRDVLSAKKKALLKREIMMLSASYGEYITLQRKNVDQYEIAFSQETGYLLGECVWHHFNRPFDMIYCETIPNTSEAILVVVKSGSVYLDGSFPVDSIAEELVIFQTQQNDFAIYIHGDVPISEKPEEGKISFDKKSVKLFTVLDAPAFPTLPTVKAFQLQLVAAVLKQQGIGVMPTKQIVISLLALGLVWMAYTYVSTHKQQLPAAFIAAANPYQEYQTILRSPDPSQELNEVSKKINLLFSIPGWMPDSIEYKAGLPGTLDVTVVSKGGKVQTLFAWAKLNNIPVDVRADSIHLTLKVSAQIRNYDNTIVRFQEVLATLIDRVAYVMPGNSLQINNISNKKSYIVADVSIKLSSLPITTLFSLADLLKGMPLALSTASLRVGKGDLTGSIAFKALGK